MNLLSLLLVSLNASSYNSRGRYFSHKHILPPIPKTDSFNSYGDEITALYTNDPESISKWIQDNIYSSSSPTIIGWDVESTPDLPWRKAEYPGPATVQMSVLNSALVIHFFNRDGTPSQETFPLIKEILEDKSLVQAGVGIDQDMLELVRFWKKTTENQPTTADIHSRLEMGGIGSKHAGGTVSLKNLAKCVIKVDLPKSRKLAMSNWSQVLLSKQQIAYAARDAWASAAILHELGLLSEAFTPQALMEMTLKDEVPIGDLDERAVARKEAKTQFLSIVGKGEDKVDRAHLTEQQLTEVKRLERLMRTLAPPRPPTFDIEPLGLSI